MAMIKLVPSMDAALESKRFLGQFMQGESFHNWRTLWRAFDALPPQPGDLEIFKLCTGRENWPTIPAEELWALIGRRGGKSVNASLEASYTAAFRQFPQLAVGEKAVISVVSPTKQQSTVIKGYISSFFRENKYLRSLLSHETNDRIVLVNRVEIAIMSADFRTLRGFSCPLVILEEAAFFRSESGTPDSEIVRAVRPALVTLNGRLVVISSAYSKEGMTWEVYSKWYGVEGGRILVWKAPSRLMNPLISQSHIDKAMIEDPEAARSEWESEFRSDLSSFVSPEIVDQCIVRGCYERSPLDGVSYLAFTDMAGGSGQDSATLAVGHAEGAKRILDCIRETRPPFSPEQTVREFSETLKQYRCHSVRGDKWAGDWPKEKFSQHGIGYETESRSKSELYVEVLPALNSGQVELLDSERLRRQLCSLERRAHPGGRQSVDHPLRGHDDVINSTAGCLVQLGPSATPGMLTWISRQHDESTARATGAKVEDKGRQAWMEMKARIQKSREPVKVTLRVPPNSSSVTYQLSDGSYPQVKDGLVTVDQQFEKDLLRGGFTRV